MGDLHHVSAGWADVRVPLVEAYDVALLDLDGVVYVGPVAVGSAPTALAAARAGGLRLAFVTNNAARPAAAVARHLCELGIPAQAEEIVTSAQAAARLLAIELPVGAAVLVIGGAGLWTAVADAGLVPVATMAHEPAAVVQGFAPTIDWGQLVEACVAVRAGLPWIATNPDATLPTPRGLAPGNGAFVDVVRRTTGGEPRFAGKPYPTIMTEAVARTGAQRALVVGDRIDTDIAGARAAGLPALLVLTGVSATVDLLAASADRAPDLLAADLSGLLTPHRAPTQDGAGWRGRNVPEVGARWQRQAGQAHLSVWAPQAPVGGMPRIALEVLRVACAAVWERRESVRTGSGHAPDLAQVRTAVAAWTAPLGWDR